MKKQKKKTPEEIQAEKVRLTVKESVTKKLDADAKSVIVKHLFDDRFRVNIWKEGKVDKSFFIVAKEDGIIQSTPEIK